jgi:uncharacterized protein (DUF58 family)
MGRALAWCERRLGVTPTGVAVIASTVLIFGAGRIAGSRGLVLLAYAGVLFLVVAWLSGQRRPTVEASRSALPARVREHQGVNVELVVRARRSLATLVLDEVLPAPLGGSRRIHVPVLVAGDEVRHGYRFAARRRGIYEVGPLVAEWSDPFGLTRRRAPVAPAERLIVHPSTQPVTDRVVSREWEDPPLRPPVSKPWPSGFELYGFRDYAAGDDPRRIAWRATARTYDAVTGEVRYFVREAEQGITDHVNLFLDTETRGHSPGDPSETFEIAVAAVASLGARHVKDGFAVNVDANSGRLAGGLRGGRARIALLDALAGARRGPEALERALGRLLLVDPGRSAHNVVVTPHLDQRTAALLRLMLERGASLLVVIARWDDTDPATLHRAGSLGCPVVELSAGAPFERQFQRVVGGARR